MDTNNASSNLPENYSGNPPVIERPIGAVAEAIHQRIQTEQQKLAAEEANEKTLTTQRISLLTDGSDKDVDACEIAIDHSRGAQLRCLERVELLAEQLKVANRKAESQRLDDVTASAERARDRGVKILKTVYPRVARQLAEALAELRDCEQTIAQANYELSAAKRETVESADPKRYAGPPGPLGLIMGYLALHELISLPNEQSPDAAPYWQSTDTLAGLALYALNVPGQRKLLTP